ncbi:hypothetical protein [Microbaculum marinum]|uniref:Sel1 repeat family protein n=1 Tax=Microbaculum marinum TaxID=1764581 RepID=A0AAW9RTU5_9HYPH
MNDAPPNHALVCGLLRDELEFRITLAQMLEARSDGLLDGIVVSTWFGEIDTIPGLRAELRRLEVSVVETEPPKHNLTGSTWAQHKAMLRGLQAIPDDAAVWKLRTDRTAHILRLFRPSLERGPQPTRRAGTVAPVFDRRVVAMAVVASVPFYAADFAFFGMKRDILKMIHFNGVYDSLFRGFGAEQRLWTHPFLEAFPRLSELYERVNILGLSTHVMRVVGEGRAIPECILYVLAFYWLNLFNNIEVIDRRTAATPHLTVRGVLGGEQCGAVRIGSVASRFTVRIATFNSQAALDRLVEGAFEDDSELGRSYRRILADLRSNGMDALPVWGEADVETLGEWQRQAPDAELLIRPSMISPAAGNRPAGDVPASILTGEKFRHMLVRESQAESLDEETLALVRETLGLVRTGKDTGKLYNMIATELLRSAGDDRAKKLLGAFFLLRAAERGDIEAAGRYGWLVYSGRLEVETRDDAMKWTGTAAVKENPLAQYTFSLMCRNGWLGDEQGQAADDWLAKAWSNGFTTEMLDAV